MFKLVDYYMKNQHDDILSIFHIWNIEKVKLGTEPQSDSYLTDDSGDDTNFKI